ncbi:MAG TPA: DUF423 domain-containing protein [Sneathiellales bacterium]|nr:DUF423 domain-containing protein [Sneathiellales bacterium]
MTRRRQFGESNLRIWLFFAGVFGFTAVGLGAIGAHVFDGQVSQENLIRFETAVRYQMWHALALLAVAWLANCGDQRPHWCVGMAGWAFTFGILFFSGSLYAFSLTDERSAATLAPVGGVSLMIGWLAVTASAVVRRTD